MAIFGKKWMTLQKVAALCLLGVLTAPQQVYAGAAPPLVVPSATAAATPCDPVYFDSLEARGWLEAQREITQNQNLIFKADSVLEYTCFDRFANVLAEQAQYMLSETKRWGEILPSDSMDNALDRVIGDALTSWVGANFGHDYLGQRWGSISPTPSGSANYVPGRIRGNATYACDAMARIWQEAKCSDFVENGAEDGFFTFQQYASDPDKRHLPARCASEPRWGTMHGTAITAPPWVDDPVWTHVGDLNEDKCGTAAFPPIPTGVTVRRPAETPNQYEEKICVQMGCYFDPNSGTCKKN